MFYFPDFACQIFPPKNILLPKIFAPHIFPLQNIFAPQYSFVPRMIFDSQKFLPKIFAPQISSLKICYQKNFSSKTCAPKNFLPRKFAFKSICFPFFAPPPPYFAPQIFIQKNGSKFFPSNLVPIIRFQKLSAYQF